MFNEVFLKVSNIKDKFSTVLKNKFGVKSVNDCENFIDKMQSEPLDFRKVLNEVFDSILFQLKPENKDEAEAYKYRVFDMADILLEEQLKIGRSKFLSGLLTYFFAYSRIIMFYLGKKATDNELNNAVDECLNNPKIFIFKNLMMSFIISFLASLVVYSGNVASNSFGGISGSIPGFAFYSVSHLIAWTQTIFVFVSLVYIVIKVYMTTKEE